MLNDIDNEDYYYSMITSANTNHGADHNGSGTGGGVGVGQGPGSVTTAGHHHHHHHSSSAAGNGDKKISELEVINLLGPVRDSLTTVVPMTFLYGLVLLTGTLGNLCTCIVIARNRYMHTATNFYLFSLAISDLLSLLLGLPQELFMLWQRYPYVFGEFFCVVRGLSSETSTNASILTITAFTIERYLAICHPLKSHTMSQLPRAIKTILVIWAISAVCALPVAWQFGIVYLINKPPLLRSISRQCGIKQIYFEYGFETSFIVFFLIPIVLITVLYVLIGFNLRRSSNQMKKHSEISFGVGGGATTDEQKCSPKFETNRTNASSNNNKNLHLSKPSNLLHHSYSHHSSLQSQSLHDSHHHQNQYQSKQHQSQQHRQMSVDYIDQNVLRHNSISIAQQKQISSRQSVIRMLVAVVIAFFVCYCPFHIQRVLATIMNRYKIQSMTIHYVYAALTHISGALYYLSATINPILYQLMSRKYRIAFRDTFSHCLPNCLKNQLAIPEITYSNMIIGNNTSAQFGHHYKFHQSPSLYSNNGSFIRRSSFQNFDSAPIPMSTIPGRPTSPLILSTDRSAQPTSSHRKQEGSSKDHQNFGRSITAESEPKSEQRKNSKSSQFLTVPSFP